MADGSFGGGASPFGGGGRIRSLFEKEMSGWLHKYGAVMRPWKRRWFRLSGDKLLYAKDETDPSIDDIPVDVVLEIALDNDPPNGYPKAFKKFCFYIKTGGKEARTYHLAAESEFEKTQWVNALQLWQKQHTARSRGPSSPSSPISPPASKPTEPPKPVPAAEPPKPQHTDSPQPTYTRTRATMVGGPPKPPAMAAQAPPPKPPVQEQPQQPPPEVPKPKPESPKIEPAKASPAPSSPISSPPPPLPEQVEDDDLVAPPSPVPPSPTPSDPDSETSKPSPRFVQDSPMISRDSRSSSAATVTSPMGSAPPSPAVTFAPVPPSDQVPSIVASTPPRVAFMDEDFHQEENTMFKRKSSNPPSSESPMASSDFAAAGRRVRSTVVMSKMTPPSIATSTAQSEEAKVEDSSESFGAREHRARSTVLTARFSDSVVETQSPPATPPSTSSDQGPQQHQEKESVQAKFARSRVTLMAAKRFSMAGFKSGDRRNSGSSAGDSPRGSEKEDEPEEPVAVNPASSIPVKDHSIVGPHPTVKKILGENGDTTVYFSGPMDKINRHGKKQRRLIMVTESGLYNLDNDTYAFNKKIPIKDIAVVFLPVADETHIALSVPSGSDYYLIGEHRMDLCEVLQGVCRVYLQKKLAIQKVKSVGWKASKFGGSERLLAEPLGFDSAPAPSSTPSSTTQSAESGGGGSGTVGAGGKQQTEDPRFGDTLELNSIQAIILLIKNQSPPESGVLLSTKVHKVNSKGKRQTRVLMCTESALYNVDDGNKYALKRRIALKDIESIKLLDTDEYSFVLKIPSEYDYVFLSSKRKEIANAIAKIAEDSGIFIDVELASNVGVTRKKKYHDGEEVEADALTIKASKKLIRKEGVTMDGCPEDYLELAKNPSVKKHISSYGDFQILFSDTIEKYNSNDKAQTRVLVVSDSAVYNLKSDYKIKRRIDLKSIASVMVSTDDGGLFAIVCPDEYDYLFESKRRIDVLKAINTAIQNMFGEELAVDNVTNIRSHLNRKADKDVDKKHKEQKEATKNVDQIRDDLDMLIDISYDPAFTSGPACLRKRLEVTLERGRRAGLMSAGDLSYKLADQKLKNVIEIEEIREELKKGLETQALDALENAITRAKKVLPEDDPGMEALIVEAEPIFERLASMSALRREMDVALMSGEEARILAAVARANEAGFPEEAERGTQAFDKLSQIKNTERIMAECISKRDYGRLRLAIQNAKVLAISSPNVIAAARYLDEWQQEDRVRKELQAAVEYGDEVSILEAISRAEQYQYLAKDVEEARARIDLAKRREEVRSRLIEQTAHRNLFALKVVVREAQEFPQLSVEVQNAELVLTELLEEEDRQRHEQIEGLRGYLRHAIDEKNLERLEATLAVALEHEAELFMEIQDARDTIKFITDMAHVRSKLHECTAYATASEIEIVIHESERFGYELEEERDRARRAFFEMKTIEDTAERLKSAMEYRDTPALAELLRSAPEGAKEHLKELMQEAEMAVHRFEKEDEFREALAMATEHRDREALTKLMQDSEELPNKTSLLIEALEAASALVKHIDDERGMMDTLELILKSNDRARLQAFITDNKDRLSAADLNRARAEWVRLIDLEQKVQEVKDGLEDALRKKDPLTTRELFNLILDSIDAAETSREIYGTLLDEAETFLQEEEERDKAKWESIQAALAASNENGGDNAFMEGSLSGLPPGFENPFAAAESGSRRGSRRSINAHSLLGDQQQQQPSTPSKPRSDSFSSYNKENLPSPSTSTSFVNTLMAGGAPPPPTVPGQSLSSTFNSQQQDNIEFIVHPFIKHLHTCIQTLLHACMTAHPDLHPDMEVGAFLQFSNSRSGTSGGVSAAPPPPVVVERVYPVEENDPNCINLVRCLMSLVSHDAKPILFFKERTAWDVFKNLKDDHMASIVRRFEALESIQRLPSDNYSHVASYFFIQFLLGKKLFVKLIKDLLANPAYLANVFEPSSILRNPHYVPDMLAVIPILNQFEFRFKISDESSDLQQPEMDQTLISVAHPSQQVKMAVKAIALHFVQTMSGKDLKQLGDDKANREIVGLVRSKLSPSLLAVFGHGLKKRVMLRSVHIWHFVQAAAESTKSETAPVTLHVAVTTINEMFGRRKEFNDALDAKFRALIVYCLNYKCLASFFDRLSHDEAAINKYFESWAILKKEETILDIHKQLEKLSKLPFRLSMDSEMY